MKRQWVRDLNEVSLKDVGSVGETNASLGEMIKELMAEGVRVPEGFALTVAAYRFHLERNKLEKPIQELLKGLNVNDARDLSARAAKIRDLIISAPLPADLRTEILQSYERLCDERDCTLGVAVRSHVTSSEGSFADQQETSLNVLGDRQLLEACKKCFASLFTERVIASRHCLEIDPFSVGISVGIQEMVRSDLACAGVLFSIDTETGLRDTVKLGSKEFKLVYDVGGVPVVERRHFTLTDDETLQLARWAVAIENHYSGNTGKPMPMDIEWAKDGITNELFVVRARPETQAHVTNFLI